MKKEELSKLRVGIENPFVGRIRESIKKEFTKEQLDEFIRLKDLHL